MAERYLLSWNSLISGYGCNGFLQSALDLLGTMRLEGFELDLVTWNMAMDVYCRMEQSVKGASPSWVSSSLLEGRKLLQNGLRWNVGNGESVQFWNDKWVYSLPGEKISSTPPHSGEVTLVAHSWDHDKLRSCVSEEERKTISKIAFFD
ncbi:hypothetical protein C3L33_14970, partial [Rhododendron williamsianum]